MRYELRDYQRDAALEVLKRIRRGRRDWREDGERSSFALSAITGSGKTVIATAVIEALLFGSTDLDTDADPRISFLWITDDPALNRQTRGRMFDASELLAPTTLVEVDESFLDADLAPGRVFFLNTQKLSRSSRLVQSGTNAREFSFWDILRNTIRGDTTDLVLVLDEAHRGMKRAADRKTIVSRLIHGEPGSNPAIPIVWGISATIERFTSAMGEVTDRTGYPNVAVDIERVRASGLIKDEIGLDQPAEKGTFSTTLLREAVKATLSFEQRWAAYSASEGEPEVLPVLVVQVPDKASDAKLTELVGTIEAEWPGLGPRAIAHVLGEHERLTLGARTVDWVYPESIQTDTEIRVVLAKEAISTGWDCPRAEVLYSERPAKDATHIAQIIGRMVRQPLAHRIATDDALNSVTCYLPLFDQKALTTIKDELEGKGADNGQNRVGATVVRAPMVFERNVNLDPAVFAFIEGLPSIPTPDRTASPLRRARTLARLLADDASGSPLLADAGAVLTERLNLRLDGLAAEYAADVDANVRGPADHGGREVADHHGRGGSRNGAGGRRGRDARARCRSRRPADHRLGPGGRRQGVVRPSIGRRAWRGPGRRSHPVRGTPSCGRDRCDDRIDRDRLGQGAARSVPGADPQHGRCHARCIYARSGADLGARGRDGAVAPERAGRDEGREG